MTCTVSVGRCDHYTSSGEYDCSVYQIQVDEGEFVQDIRLEDADELITLRNALDAYITANNLTRDNHEH